MVEQDGPELPAAIAGKIPAARTESTICCKVLAEHPSLAGHTQELLMESGANVGSPWFGFPFTGYGAIKNWKHSEYVVGEPLPPESMFRQAIHCAPGATPMWLLPPSSPTISLTVKVPCPCGSIGVGECCEVASCQL